MWFPSNHSPRTRPAVSPAHLEALSLDLTAKLRAIQERERNHAALVNQSAAILPTLRPRFANLTASDIDVILQ